MMDDRTAAVQRMQDYIAKSLAEELRLSDLARQVHFSPWYAHRLFREMTGYTPAEYRRRLRLSEAARRLKEGGLVTEIALDSGFGSLDGFTRAFRQTFGITPLQYRLHPIPLPLFIPYGVKFRMVKQEETHMEQVKSVFVQVVEKPERKVIVKRGVKAAEYMAYCEEVGCDIWGTLTSMDSLCGEPVCLWLPEQYIKEGTSSYVQGVEVEVDDAAPIPEGFDSIRLPSCTYLMFQGEPFCEEDYCAAIEQVQTAMDRYRPEFIGYVWDDANPRIQLEPIGKRGYIELRAVKPLTK